MGQNISRVTLKEYKNLKLRLKILNILIVLFILSSFWGIGALYLALLQRNTVQTSSVDYAQNLNFQLKYDPQSYTLYIGDKKADLSNLKDMIKVGPGLIIENSLLSVDAPQCGDQQVLTWNGSEFLCVNIQGDLSYTNELVKRFEYLPDQSLLVLADAGGEKTVDISNLKQQLQLSGTLLSITEGNAVDLSAFLDNTDNQTLNFDGTTYQLSISGGNVVDLSALKDTYTAGSGLQLSGNVFSLNAGIDLLTDVDTSTTPPTAGQVLKWDGANWVPANDIDTDTLSSLSCSNGQVAKWDGSNWSCANDIDTDTLATLSCANGEIARWNGSAWVCSADQDTTYTAGDGLALTGTQFSISSPTCSGTDKLQWNGTAFVCAPDQDTTYTAGTGLQLAGTTFSLNATLGQLNDVDTTGASAGQVLKWNGTNWVPSTDNDTTYTAGGTLLQLTGTTFSLKEGTLTNGYLCTYDSANGLVCNTDPTTVGTDSQTLTFNTGTGQLSISNGNTVDLSIFWDNTDNQTLSLSGNTLSISGGNSVDLSAYLDNTDNQTLTWDATTDQLTISGGNTVSLADLTQTLTLSGNTLSISSGNSVTFTNWDTDVTDDVQILTDLQDVTITSPATAQVLRYDGTTWVNSLLNFSDISDVNTTGATAGQVLRYNGTTWVPYTLRLVDLADTPAGYGTYGQVLATDGAGNLFWRDMSQGIFDTDLDTGMWVEKTADEDWIRFDTAGIERMYITTDGRISIAKDTYLGVTDQPISPTADYTFSIGARANNDTTRSTHISFVQTTGNGGYISFYTYQQGNIWTTERMRLTDGALEVYVPVFSGSFIIPSTNNKTSLSEGVLHLASTTDNYIRFTDDGARFLGALGFVDGDADLVYKSGATTIRTGTERFRITQFGHVVINQAYTLPNVDGTAGQVLQTDGAGTVSWVDLSAVNLGSITQHSDVDTTTTPPTAGQVLKWDGTNWVPGNDNDTTYTAGTGLQLTGTTFSLNATLGQLNDVTTTGATAGQLLRFDGTTWTPQTLAFTDLSDTPANYGTAGYLVQTDGTGSLQYVDPLTLDVGYWQRTGTTLSPRNAGDDIVLNAGESLSISDLGAGGVVFTGTGGLLSTNPSAFYWDATNNRLGIGTATPTAPLHVSSNFTDQTAVVGIRNVMTYTADTATTSQFYQGAYYNTTGRVNQTLPVYVRGMTTAAAKTVASGQSDTGYLIGHWTQSFILDNGTGAHQGTLSNLEGMHVNFGIYGTAHTGSVNNAYGVRITPYVQSGSVNNLYGLFISNMAGSATSVTNYFGIYQADPNAKNYLAGNLGVGTTAPDATLHVYSNVSSQTFKVEGPTVSGVLPGWNFRRQVTITNSTANILTDYQVKIVLDTASLISAGKMRADCGDLRITASDGSTALSYWVEGPCNATNTVIWAKVPSIPANGTQIIYVYYGNPSAVSMADGAATFDFFDDFDNTTVDTTKWNVVSTSYTLGSSILRLNNGGLELTAPLPFNLQDGYAAEARVRFEVTTGGYSGGIPNLGSSSFTAGSNGNADATVLYMRNGNSTTVATWVGDGSTTGYNIIGGSGVWTSTNGTWYITGVSVDGGNLQLWRDYSVMLSRTGITWFKNLRYIKIGYFASGATDIQDTSYDWVRIRKYISSEPATTLGAEETPTGTTTVETNILVKDGNVGIRTLNPQYALQVGDAGDGTIAVANAWVTFSDRRFKENITDITGALGVIKQLRGVTYTWKQSGKKGIGFIAQEVKKVLPDAVYQSMDGRMSVDYVAVVPYLTEAVKELNKRLEALEGKVGTGGPGPIGLYGANTLGSPTLPTDATFSSVTTTTLTATTVDASVINTQQLSVGNGALSVDTSGNIVSSGNIAAQGINASTLQLSGQSYVIAAGEVVLPAGSTSVDVTNSDIDQTVVVTVTPKDVPVTYAVSVTAGGFRIIVAQAPTQDVVFYWVATKK